MSSRENLDGIRVSVCPAESLDGIRVSVCPAESLDGIRVSVCPAESLDGIRVIVQRTYRNGSHMKRVHLMTDIVALVYNKYSRCNYTSSEC